MNTYDCPSQGRDCESCRLMTRAVLKDCAPWLAVVLIACWSAFFLVVTQ